MASYIKHKVFKFPGDILIQKMHSSGILRFDDSVNDMNFWSKFKYTSKGKIEGSCKTPLIAGNSR